MGVLASKNQAAFSRFHQTAEFEARQRRTVHPAIPIHFLTEHCRAGAGMQRGGRGFLLGDIGSACRYAVRARGESFELDEVVRARDAHLSGVLLL